MPTTGEASLYFHLPFCRRKCPYCHFYVVPIEDHFQQMLLSALSLEWQRCHALVQDKKIVSIYFGGGTPFLIGPEAIQEIVSWIAPSSSVEVTLEANPEDVTLSAMQRFKKAGVNRVSLGIQALDNSLLKILGRYHTAEQAKQAVVNTFRAGIENITIDLMYEIPTQTLASWKDTLAQVAELPIRHLSLYNLTFEPQTLFFKKRALLTPQLPTSEDSLQMLQMAIVELEKQGLQRYEISAFAKPGFISRHNTGYWEGRPFLGFGPSAFSDWEGRRYRNLCDLKKYAEALKANLSPIDFEEKLSARASLHERLAIRLRLLEGVNISEYPIDPALYQKLLAKGWLEIKEGRAKLSEAGKLFYDSVAEEIVLLEP